MAEFTKVPETSRLPVVAPKAKKGAGSAHSFATIQRQLEANWDESLEMPQYSPVMANRAAANLLGAQATNTDTASVGGEGTTTVQRACAECAEEQKADEEKPKIQTKLAIGQPGDKYEQEADEVARQVVDQIHASPTSDVNNEAGATLQRQELPATPAMTHITLMRQETGEITEASTDVEDRIQRSRGQGQPLGDAVQAPMEQAFGTDFSAVRIHTDGESDELNQAVQAKAFTTGQDIYFRDGAYEPENRSGQELLAHELTHVVQQSSQALPMQSNSSNALDYVQRIPGDETEEQPVTSLSGYYECLQDEEDFRKKTALFLNVNQLTLVGNYRSFIDHDGGGYDILDSGDVQGERVSEAGSLRYDVSSTVGLWAFNFEVSREALGIQRTLPLIATAPDGEEMVFRRRGSERPITAQDVATASGSDAVAIEHERRRGLTPDMIADLDSGALRLVRELNSYPEEALRGQREIFRRSIVQTFDGILSTYSGGLRTRARAYLLEQLSHHEVHFLGDTLPADQAIIEASGETTETTSDGTEFHYEIIFRGIRGSGRAIAGVQLASGSVEVRAFRASRLESADEIAWTRFYHFAEVRVQAQAGAGLSGGIYWQTFHASSPVEWTQADFADAEIGIFGVSGPSAQGSVGVGPVSTGVGGGCTTYQFSGVAFMLDTKTLELQAEEQIFRCSPTGIDSESGGLSSRSDESRQRSGQVGIDIDLSAGQLESGLGHVEGIPGQDYSDERQQLDGGEGSRQVEVEPSPAYGGFGVASSTLERSMMLSIVHHLSPHQQELQNPAIPIRIIGHASSLWHGRTDSTAGNMALSRSRAETVARLIRQVFELPEDRLFDISARGDQEHRAVGGTVEDDDPAYRRVDVLIQSRRPISIHF